MNITNNNSKYINNSLHRNIELLEMNNYASVIVLKSITRKIKI